MPSGGARLRAGAVPDPNALRRDRADDKSWTTLPATAKPTKVPTWPLTIPTDREAELWATWWTKPQAMLWERNQQVYEVALHIRCFAEAEEPKAATALRTLVRQQADALLLTIPAMLAARVRIAGDEVAATRTRRAVQKAASPGGSTKDRLRAIDAG